MLLCEVALGKMNELFAADYHADRLPKNKQSVKGVGRTYSDETHWKKLEDGTIIPMGPVKVDESLRSSLIYVSFLHMHIQITFLWKCFLFFQNAFLKFQNEYIVYNTQQVKFRYLVKLNFKYKY